MTSLHSLLPTRRLCTALPPCPGALVAARSFLVCSCPSVLWCRAARGSAHLRRVRTARRAIRRSAAVGIASATANELPFAAHSSFFPSFFFFFSSPLAFILRFVFLSLSLSLSRLPVRVDTARQPHSAAVWALHSPPARPLSSPFSPPFIVCITALAELSARWKSVTSDWRGYAKPLAKLSTTVLVWRAHKQLSL